MKPIPFVGGAYEARSVGFDHSRCVNLYVEKHGDDSFLVGTPGQRPLYVLNGPIRSEARMGARTFIVAGSTLYETTGDIVVALGTLQTSTGVCDMAASATQVLIVDGVTGYVFETAFAEIGDEDFPSGVTTAQWEGNFFIVGVDGTEKFYISALNDATAWDGLDFASAEKRPGILLAIRISHDRVWLFTTEAIEVWANTGALDFPFERDNGFSIDVGLEAAVSVMNSGMYWIGQDDNGGRVVYAALAGGAPQRVSTHGIETILGAAPVDEAYSIAYQQEGHSFCCWTLPAVNRSIVYDAATQEWHERQYNGGAWNPTIHLFDGRHLVGDGSGQVSVLDLDCDNDAGVPILCLRSTAPLKNGMERVKYDALQIDGETATDTTMQLRISNDGGQKWSDTRLQSTGNVGQTRKRVLYRRLGRARSRVWELSFIRKGRVALYGAYVETS